MYSEWRKAGRRRSGGGATYGGRRSRDPSSVAAPSRVGQRGLDIVRHVPHGALIVVIRRVVQEIRHAAHVQAGEILELMAEAARLISFAEQRAPSRIVGAVDLQPDGVDLALELHAVLLERGDLLGDLGDAASELVAPGGIVA